MTEDKNLYKKIEPLKGSVMSKDLSPIGVQMKTYLEYAGKIARVASEQMTLVKTEQPEGLKTFLKAVEDEEKRKNRPLKADERKVLEQTTRYVTRPVKLGNPTAMFNAVLHELTSENKHWQELIAKAKDEIKRMASQAGAEDKVSNFDERDLL